MAYSRSFCRAFFMLAFAVCPLSVKSDHNAQFPRLEREFEVPYPAVTQSLDGGGFAFAENLATDHPRSEYWEYDTEGRLKVRRPLPGRGWPAAISSKGEVFLDYTYRAGGFFHYQTEIEKVTPANTLVWTHRLAQDPPGQRSIFAHFGGAILLDSGPSLTLTKISETGELLWTNIHHVQIVSGSVHESVEGGLFLLGSIQGGVNSHGSADFWVAKFTGAGALEWERQYGGSGDDIFTAAQATENGFVLIGESNSAPGGGKDAPHYGGKDWWALAVDREGRRLWDRSYGGSRDETAPVFTRIGTGWIMAGRSVSAPNGVSKTAPYKEPGHGAAWVVVTDAQGNQIADESYPGAEPETGWTGGDPYALHAGDDLRVFMLQWMTPPVARVLNLNITPTFREQPNSHAAFLGRETTFSAWLAEPLTFGAYQWLFNGAEIPGATNNVLTITNVTTDNFGAYSLRATTPFGSATTSAAILYAADAFMELTMHPSVTIYGQLQDRFEIQSAEPTPPLQWQSEAIITLTNSPQVWVETDAAIPHKRIYRLIKVGSAEP